MPAERTCPQCGTILSPAALEGLCPKCVGRAAFDHPSELPPLSADLEEQFARLKPEESGECIGHYKLLQNIGEGGFGVVWMAEQERPVRRRVALKIIKLGMDTKEVIARFEQERQALAMMDHPNIAKVFDAGATQFGRPFFVMELVRGIKITDYCDQANLPTAERLRLFIAVCHAVQHAHQKGIIHRDLKPSNVLVTMHDGVPVPKVIDFGVAKATQSVRLTDLTLFTQFEQMIGTPLYMSPEQAEMSGLDIDTRSDIYSLGVLLYELLTGRTPFDPEELMQKGYDEIRRAIREQEPQTPSLFLKTMGAERRATVAQHRQSDPAALTKIVHGDLDWIVMKALEKDRTRRYETANGLAMDIQRHLANEPVHARAASQMYRFRRLVKRNKVAFTAGVAIALTLIAGFGVSLWQAKRRVVEVAAERDQTELARQEAEAISSFLVEVFQSPDAGRDGRTITVVETIDRAVKKLDTSLVAQPSQRAKLQGTLGRAYTSLGLYREAIPLFEQARHYYLAKFGPAHPAALSVGQNLAFSYGKTGRKDEGLKLIEEVFPLYRKVLGPENPGTLMAMNTLGIYYNEDGRSEEAIKLFEEELSLYRKALGPESNDTLRALGNLSVSYHAAGRKEEALKTQEDQLAVCRKALGPEHLDTLWAITNLASLYAEAGRIDEAFTMRKDVLAVYQRILGPEHPTTRYALNKLADSYSDAGRLDDALPFLTEASAHNPEDTVLSLKIAALAAWFGLDAEYTAACQRLSEQAMKSNDAEAAERAAKAYCLRPSSDANFCDERLKLAHRAADLGKTHTGPWWFRMTLGMAEYRQGNQPAADMALGEAEQTANDVPVVQGTARLFLAMSLFRQGKKAQARQLFDKAEAQMKPLPSNKRSPLNDGASHDDLILWLAYKEAKAMLIPPEEIKSPTPENR